MISTFLKFRIPKRKPVKLYAYIYICSHACKYLCSKHEQKISIKFRFEKSNPRYGFPFFCEGPNLKPDCLQTLIFFCCFGVRDLCVLCPKIYWVSFYSVRENERGLWEDRYLIICDEMAVNNLVKSIFPIVNIWFFCLSVPLLVFELNTLHKFTVLVQAIYFFFVFFSQILDRIRCVGGNDLPDLELRLWKNVASHIHGKWPAKRSFIGNA